MRGSQYVQSAARRFYSVLNQNAIQKCDIKHIRATKNGVGRFYTLSKQHFDVTKASPEEVYLKMEKYDHLNAYVHSLSRGVVDSYNNLSDDIRQKFTPGYETVLENKSDLTAIINAKNLGLPPAVIQYNMLNDEHNTTFMDVFETFVAEELRGKGIAKELAQSVVEYAQNYGFKIKPSCSFINAYISENAPELAYK